MGTQLDLEDRNDIATARTIAPEVALFPVFLNLTDRSVVLVGGGAVAYAKLGELVRAGAHVTVVAPEIRPEIASFDGLIIVQREFVPRDLDGAWFVVAAASPEVNRRVAAAAEERRVFVNAVDDAAGASAYAGGVFRRGSVTIAVSTEGRAPALAGLLREGLEALVPEDVETWVLAARRLRHEQRAAGVPMGERRPLLLRALNRLYASRGIETEVRP
jgi:uroporphyrin-III C-methyltransferase / precorrin-2 dehydrogenase / sirohydrochlorin ferrochelatase